ncbi:putative MFS-type transporter [Neofusicoccum parvum]|nr:putative MFS-type transporter [Neofusicoccum parvum]
MSEKTTIGKQSGFTRIVRSSLLANRAPITADILSWNYEGGGTTEDPYVAEWITDDPGNPLLWKSWYKWFVALTVAQTTLCVSFCSSAYSGGIEGIKKDLSTSHEVATVGLSLFVLGFGLGPLIWAPLSEMYGRRVIFFITFGALTCFNAGTAGAQNIQTVIVLRFLGGTFGASPFTNAGGVISDIFNATERGLAMSIFAAAPFMGPVIGPLVGGFLGETEGWRWIQGVMTIFSGVVWIFASIAVPETYAPVLLKRRAAELSRLTGKVYLSKLEADNKPVALTEALYTNLSRPWILLFQEPIVLLLSFYMAIIYGTLYMLFGAYPIVYQQYRGWSAGVAGLPFIGVAIGMLASVAYSIWVENPRYLRVIRENDGNAPPEARLPPSLLGAVALPIGLFWFAWTNSPSLPWPASVAAGAPFGFAMVLVFLSVMNYLVDSYTIYAASVLAANSVFRAVFGAVFPLFTRQMYDGLGIHWASTIPAFLALICLPFPFLFHRFGEGIRSKCKYSAIAAAAAASLQKGSSRPETLQSA